LLLNRHFQLESILSRSRIFLDYGLNLSFSSVDG
jgi:hypothetical protein